MKVNVSQFKEQCLALLDNLNPEGIVITKDGCPINSCKRRLCRTDWQHEDGIQVQGEILSTGFPWNAHGDSCAMQNG